MGLRLPPSCSLPHGRPREQELCQVAEVASRPPPSLEHHGQQRPSRYRGYQGRVCCLCSSLPQGRGEPASGKPGSDFPSGKPPWSHGCEMAAQNLSLSESPCSCFARAQCGVKQERDALVLGMRKLTQPHGSRALWLDPAASGPGKVFSCPSMPGHTAPQPSPDCSPPLRRLVKGGDMGRREVGMVGSPPPCPQVPTPLWAHI